jgi:hypothetical protein
MYNLARELNLSIFAWTFRIDELPGYVKSFNELLDIFTKISKVDGIITDFPADVISYLTMKNTSARLFSSLFLLLSLNVLFFLL